VKRAGFTFIELMFVVITLAIITAAVLPRFGPSLDRLQTERVAFDTAGQLRYAQSLAIRRREPVYVSLREGPSGRHTVVLSAEPEGAPLDDRYAKSRALPLDIQMTIDAREAGDDAAPLAFFADGTSLPAELTVKDRRGSAYRITVDETTGQVAVLAGLSAD
jgi:type II secretory pathway pseudopilin PulG